MRIDLVVEVVEALNRVHGAGFKDIRQVPDSVRSFVLASGAVNVTVDLYEDRAEIFSCAKKFIVKLEPSDIVGVVGSKVFRGIQALESLLVLSGELPEREVA
jgi:hypothetical protein